MTRVRRGVAGALLFLSASWLAGLSISAQQQRAPGETNQRASRVNPSDAEQAKRAAAAADAGASALSPAEQRGRQIFLHGANVSGRVVPAALADAVVPSAIACASCHGRDGRGGRDEGGVRPADLAWDRLTRATGARPAYTAPLLRRVIGLGIDAGGRPLTPAMPRYQLTRDESDDLLAWLQRMNNWRDPGVDDSTVRLLVSGPMRHLFSRWADDVNARGGIYARRIVLVDAIDDAHASAFALLGEPDEAVTREAVGEEMPVLRAGTLDAPRGPWVFDLGPAPEDEVRRLIEVAEARGAGPVVVPAGPFAAICPPPRCRVAGDVDPARGRAGGAVLVLDPRAMPEAGRLALVPSAIAAAALPHARGDALVSARILPTDIAPEAAARWSLTGDRLVDQWSALAVAMLTERALLAAGRDLTRERFVFALTTPFAQPTGFSPPIAFGSGRHFGIGIVRLLHFDHASGQLTAVPD